MWAAALSFVVMICGDADRDLSEGTYTLPQMLNPGRFMFGDMEDPVAEGSKLLLRPWEARIYKRPL